MKRHGQKLRARAPSGAAASLLAPVRRGGGGQMGPAPHCQHHHQLHLLTAKPPTFA